MPIRLSLFLIGALLFLVFLVGNGHPVRTYVILFQTEQPLGRLLLVSAAFGALLSYLLVSHLRTYGKMRKSHKQVSRIQKAQKKGTQKEIKDNKEVKATTR